MRISVRITTVVFRSRLIDFPNGCQTKWVPQLSVTILAPPEQL
jgi:hypothetical protein